MKTTSMKNSRFLMILALISWFGMDLAQARVQLFSRSNLEGAVISIRPGVWEDRHFAQFFRDNPKSTDCSFRIPQGYLLEIDYYGHGLEDRRTRKYTGSKTIRRSGRKFKKIRVRRLGTTIGKVPEPRCNPDWGAKLFTESYYKGVVTCMSEETILPTHKPKSFKVRPGYVLILFKQGEEVRRFTKNTTYFGWPFDYVRVMKDYSNSSSSSNARTSNARTSNTRSSKAKTNNSRSSNLNRSRLRRSGRSN